MDPIYKTPVFHLKDWWQQIQIGHILGNKNTTEDKCHTNDLKRKLERDRKTFIRIF